MAENLGRLKGSQRIRQRASVNLGSDGIAGVQQTFFEIVSNSIDRFKKGYGTKVIIKKYKDLSYSVQDFADGLPIEWNEDEQAYNWDIALKVLYGGENYEEANRSNGTLGFNGLGLVSAMYSSEYMNVQVTKNNYDYELNFKEGRPVDINTGEFLCDDLDDTLSEELGRKVFSKIDSIKEISGTYIKYRPDKTVFSDIDIPIEWLKLKLKKQAVVNQRLYIYFEDEITGFSEIYNYSNIDEYIEELGQDCNIVSIYNFKGEDNGKDMIDKPIYNVTYDFSFTFNNDYPQSEYYHNSSELLELNKNVTTKAIENAFTNAIHNYLTQNKLYNKGEKIKFSDIEDSLLCVLSSKSSNTSYANQTKLSIDNKFIKDFISKDIEDKLSVYLTENPMDAKQITNQILINKRANDKAQKTKLDIKNKLQGTKKGLKLKIEGLRDCDMKNSQLEDRIFLVDEGLSANSTIADSFDNTIMGCLGLRGRFINSLKKPCSISDVLNNTPALGIIQAMGCGIEIPKSELKHFKDIETFDINNLRYGSIGLLCDSDAFGHGINLSILTFLYKYMPTLVKQGRVYIVISPRFEITDKKGNVYYVYNEEEKQQKIKEIGQKNIDSIGIKKGLGEFNKDEFWDYVLSPKAREKSFIKIKYNENEEEQIDYYFNMLMGDDIDNRKIFIRERIVNVDLNELD